MQEKVTWKEFVSSPVYDQMSTSTSKAFTFWFSIFCLYFGIFSEYSVGIWWILIWIVGVFVSSIVFAFLSNIIKAVSVINSAKKSVNKNVKLPWWFHIIDILFLILMFLLMKYFLSVCF